MGDIRDVVDDAEMSAVRTQCRQQTC